KVNTQDWLFDATNCWCSAAQTPPSAATPASSDETTSAVRERPASSQPTKASAATSRNTRRWNVHQAHGSMPKECCSTSATPTAPIASTAQSRRIEPLRRGIRELYDIAALRHPRRSAGHRRKPAPGQAKRGPQAPSRPPAARDGQPNTSCVMFANQLCAYSTSRRRNSADALAGLTPPETALITCAPLSSCPSW